MDTKVMERVCGTVLINVVAAIVKSDMAVSSSKGCCRRNAMGGEEVASLRMAVEDLDNTNGGVGAG